jgi:hypothetical protein
MEPRKTIFETSFEITIIRTAHWDSDLMLVIYRVKLGNDGDNYKMFAIS